MTTWGRLALGAFFLALLGCNLVTGPDLRAKAQKDADVARAASKQLTITSNSAGTTQPSGTFEIKDGIAFEIEGSAQPEFVLIGWKQTGGDGTAVFSTVDDSTTKVSVVVTGGDATIEPVYEARPVLLYMTPIGNNIAKNSPVRLVFNREVDLGEVSSPLVTIKKQGVTLVPYVLSTKAGDTTVTLKPTDASLGDNTQYIVNVQAGVVVKASFDQEHYPGVTIINTQVVSRSEVTTPFQTGSNFDTLPPYNGSFDLVSLTGNAVYTDSPKVMLKHLYALDDSGEGGVATFSVRNGVDPFDGIDQPYVEDGDFTWLLPDSVDGAYTVGAIFADINGNEVPETSAIERTIYLDALAPTVSSFTLTSSGAAPGFVSTTKVPFLLSAHDPVISGTAILGSGESVNGSTPSEHKKYRLGNDAGTWTAWKSFAASGTADLGVARDGLRTVQVEVMDAMGNVSSSTAATVTLDQTGPTIGVTLADTTLITKSASITLNLAASDAGSGVFKMNLGTGSLGLVTGAGAATLIYADDGGIHATKTLAADGTMATPIVVPDQLGLSLTPGDGPKRVEFVLVDNLGNAATTDVDLVLDTTPPTPGTSKFEAAATSTASAVVNLGASDSGTGLARVGWIADESPAAPSVAGATWQAYQPSITVTLLSSASVKTQYLHLWFEDVAGNVSSHASASIEYDTTPPVLSVSLPSANINTDTVTVTWSAAANGNKKIAHVDLSNNGTTWSALSIASGQTSLSTSTTWSLVAGGGGSSTEGNRKVWLRSEDDTGVVTTQSTNFKFDKTSPTLDSVALVGTGGSLSTNSTTVAITFDISDTWTPVTSLGYEMSDDAFVHKVQATALAASVSTTFTFLNTTNETKTVSVRVIDLAGNVCRSKSATIKFDTVAPTWNSPPSLDAGAAYTVSGVVGLTSISAADGTGSGVSKMRLSNNNSTWTSWMTYATSYSSWSLTTGNGGSATVGAKYAYVQVQDAAGNVSASTVDGITFDNVAPTAGSPTAAATSVGTRVVTVTNNSVADTGGSSVVSMRYGVGSVTTNWIPYASTIKVLLTPRNGSKTVSVYYKDGAGNVSSAKTITFTLTEYWPQLTGRDEMVWADYDAPVANPVYPSPGTSQEDTSWMTSLTLTLGNTNATDTLTPTLAPTFVFKTLSGQIGKFKYTLPAGQISLSYVTFNSSNVITQTVSPYYGQINLLSTGTPLYVDFDAQSNNVSTSLVAGVSDAVLKYFGSQFQIVPLSFTDGAITKTTLITLF